MNEPTQPMFFNELQWSGNPSAGLRRLMIASWEEARRTHFVKREDLRG